MVKTLFTVAQSSNAYSIGILIVRIVAGIAMMLHGQKKIADPLGWMGAESTVPAIFQAMAAVSEFIGGFCIIIGLLTPLSAFGIVCTMAVAVHKHAILQNGPFVGKGSYEMALLYFCLMILLLLAGPGKYAVDRWLFGKK